MLPVSHNCTNVHAASAPMLLLRWRQCLSPESPEAAEMSSPRRRLPSDEEAETVRRPGPAPTRSGDNACHLELQREPGRDDWLIAALSAPLGFFLPLFLFGTLQHVVVEGVLLGLLLVGDGGFPTSCL